MPAAENVERRGEMHAIAGVGNGTLVELDVAFVIVEDAVFVEEAHIVKDGTRVTGILEVLGGEIGLHEAEVIGTGEVERPGILKVHVRLEFGAVAVGDGGVLVRPVDESGEVEGAGLPFMCATWMGNARGIRSTPPTDSCLSFCRNTSGLSSPFDN